jgi:predicted amidophosphoribosyltransferase
MVIQPLPANPAWDCGISLDKHTISSTPIGPNEYGHMQFDTQRTAVGEAVFRLKYRDDYQQVGFLAQAVATALAGRRFDRVIPMPASRQRTRQPVHEVARQVAALLGSTYTDEVLVKTWSTGMMKDLDGYEQRVKALAGCFSVNAPLEASCDVLVLDDLFDTGASLQAACTALRECASIRGISVVALTRRQ